MKVQLYVHIYLGCLCRLDSFGHTHDSLFWERYYLTFAQMLLDTMWNAPECWELIDSWDEVEE